MYLDEQSARAIRKFWETELKANVPSIKRLSVRRDHPGAFYLEIGIRMKHFTPAEKAWLDTKIINGELAGPAPLGAPGPLTVRIVRAGRTRLLDGDYAWTGDEEPLRGGHKVAPTGSPFGTLGCLVRLVRNGELDTTNTFFLSCWHVLSGPGDGTGGPLEWPRSGGNDFSMPLGLLYWSKVDENVDVAIGMIENCDVKIGEGFAWSRIAACPVVPSSPTSDSQRVVVCGQESQADGEIVDMSATTYVDIPGEPDHKFVDQIMTKSMCMPGDSGAFLFLESGMAPIGMACCNDEADDGEGGDDLCTYFNKLEPLFSHTFEGAEAQPNALNDRSFQIHSIIVETGGDPNGEDSDTTPKS